MKVYVVRWLLKDSFIDKFRICNSPDSAAVVINKLKAAAEYLGATFEIQPEIEEMTVVEI